MGKVKVAKVQRERTARYVVLSGNSKTGPCSATYAAQASCPPFCPLRRKGCYAESGNVAFTTRRVNAAADAQGADAHAVAVDEAAAIDEGAVIPGLPLRIHVVGDCTTPGAAALVAGAARRRVARGGGRAWTYTHAWRDVPRAAWAGVSVLASVDSVEDIQAARAQGYAPAVVVAAHREDGKPQVAPDGTRLIACPAQTRGVQCVDCRLCWDADALRDRRMGIAFRPESRTSTPRAMRARLPVLQ